MQDSKSQQRKSSDRWVPVEGEEGTFRSGDAVLTFDGTHVQVMRNGDTWEESFGHPDGLQPHGFHPVLDSWLREGGLDGTGLEQACDRIERDAIAAEIREQVEEQERQIEEAQAQLDDARGAVQEARDAIPAGSFEERVTSRRVDLVTLVKEGIEPMSYIPGSAGTLIAKARHQATAPRKVGKSICWQMTAIRIALEGGKVVTVDRENGERRYGLRLEDMMAAWGLTPEQLRLIQENWHYFPWPTLLREDKARLAEEWAAFDLVVFDSQRGFMTGLGLKENESDDYSEFMDALIDPLHQAGVATLVLHNTGYGDKDRGRGSSSQGDLHDVLLSMKKTEPYFIDTTGKVFLEIKENREGHSGAWACTIGGGVYGDWEQARSGDGSAKGSGERKDANVEQTRILLAEDPGITNKQIAEVLDVDPKTARSYRKLAAGG
jgi:hypothetical protein